MMTVHKSNSVSDNMYKYDNTDLIVRVLSKNSCTNLNTLLKLSPPTQTHSQKHGIHFKKEKYVQ